MNVSTDYFTVRIRNTRSQRDILELQQAAQLAYQIGQMTRVELSDIARAARRRIKQLRSLYR